MVISISVVSCASLGKLENDWSDKTGVKEKFGPHMSKTYLIVLGSPKDEIKIQSYKEVAGAVMRKYGGVMPPVNYKIEKILVGDSTPSFMLKVEFPSKENILNAFNDSEYAGVVEDRDAGFANLSIFIISE